MIKHKVMYAELRPMLMDKTIPSDDGESKLDHNMQMELILDEIRKYQDELRASNQLHKFPFGLKIIYCTPRSIPKEWMQREIQDCIKLKLQFPDLICGFDLVGAEDRPNHIGYYRDELLAMVQTCKRLQIEIPFMFHAGETLLDTGGSKDPLNSNLYECVLLNAKRIGHGFALLKHPVLVEQFRKKNICVELCPTSNELLHLCRNVKEHPFPKILAQGIPCTVNADNPSLFRYALILLTLGREAEKLSSPSNSVSHEFYQIMVGSPAMSVHGWKQLCHWSIQYSCLSNEQKQEAFTIFARDWEAWCTWVVSTYGQYANDLEVRL
jgi:adenosine deaminase CECR1